MRSQEGLDSFKILKLFIKKLDSIPMYFKVTKNSCTKITSSSSNVCPNLQNYR